MNWFLNVQLALKSIQSNLLRSILTILIIATGIMALVGILTAIDSIKESIVTNFSVMGASTFSIKTKGLSARGGIQGEQPKTYDPVDYQAAIAFKHGANHQGIVSINTRASSIATVKYKSEKTNPNVTVMGVDENYLQVSGYRLLNGRNFSKHEVEMGQNTVILGFSVADRLFNIRDSLIQRTVTIGNVKYRVIGILEAKGASIVGSDNLVLITAMNARKVFLGNTEQFMISVAVDHPEKLDQIVEESRGFFRIIRNLSPLKEDDFEISRSDKLAETVIKELRYVTMAATVIGLVTLLAAGIGLMNIMLVAVAERTREIGISKAIGATNRIIKSQFLTEAIVICQIGGILGIILGILAGNIVSVLLDGSFIIPWVWIISGFIFCFLIGLLAGIYPAIKAAKLDPIEALRYE